MAFGADHEESAEFGNAGGEFDVSAAACHVGGDRDCAGVACARNDFRFLFVEFRVENRVRDLGAFEHPRKRFGGFDGGGADEAGLADCVGFLDF